MYIDHWIREKKITDFSDFFFTQMCKYRLSIYGKSINKHIKKTEIPNY